MRIGVMLWDPTEEYQRLMDRGLPGEHYLVALTAREALKCAELVRAVLVVDASRDVARLLAAVAVGVCDEEGPALAGLRVRIEDYPWPP